jgi:hypothetical protein
MGKLIKLSSHALFPSLPTSGLARFVAPHPTSRLACLARLAERYSSE